MIFINMILIFENAMMVFLLQNNNILATMSLSRFLVNKRVGLVRPKIKNLPKNRHLHIAPNPQDSFIFKTQ